MAKIANLDKYFPMMEFLSEMVGVESEIVLYDAKKLTVHAVLNPLDTEMTVGSEIRGLESDFIENNVHLETNYIVNYRALTKSNKKLKSGTFFLKDDKGQLEAIMTVNIKVDKLLEFRDVLNVLVSGSNQENEKKFYNCFDVSVEGFVNQTIQEELAKLDVEPARLSPKEKVDLVKALDEKGIFLVKGAISELANALGTTDTTIYRYLSKNE